MKDMYTVLAAQWKVSRTVARLWCLGENSNDPAEDLTDKGMETLRAVVKVAIRRRDAEERINSHD